MIVQAHATCTKVTNSAVSWTSFHDVPQKLTFTMKTHRFGHRVTDPQKLFSKMKDIELWMRFKMSLRCHYLFSMTIGLWSAFKAS